MTLTKYQREVLSMFAASRTARSRYEVFGHLATAQAGQALDTAISELRAAYLLVALPTGEQCDPWGGTQFLTSPKGRMLLSASDALPRPTFAGSANGTQRRAAS